MAFLLDLIFPGLGLVFQAISLTSKMSELSDEDKQDKMAEEMFQVIDKNNDGCLEGAQGAARAAAFQCAQAAASGLHAL